MTLRKLYSELSKIIDKECETNPDALDKQIALCIMPCTTNAADLNKCGHFGAASVINDKDRITITNYYK